MKKTNLPQFLAEGIGTFFLVLFGCGSVILTQAGPGTVDGMTIPIVFGGIVSILIYGLGHISGAHFNPAVTIAFFVTRKFPGKKLLGYVISQILGALAASFCHYLVWKSIGHNFGATLPSVSVYSAIGAEFILSFLLMFIIISVATDTRAVGEMAGIAIGTTVALCAFVGGPLTGASMNPARSLAPMLFHGELTYLVLYLIVPIIGTVCGALTYEKIKCIKEESESDHGCC